MNGAKLCDIWADEAQGAELAGIFSDIFTPIVSAIPGFGGILGGVLNAGATIVNGPRGSSGGGGGGGGGTGSSSGGGLRPITPGSYYDPVTGKVIVVPAGGYVDAAGGGSGGGGAGSNTAGATMPAWVPVLVGLGVLALILRK